jgi:gamma-glutamylcyclotransferase (GGCT)/AIG2-like uncharacterized protein YtfP
MAYLTSHREGCPETLTTQLHNHHHMGEAELVGPARTVGEDYGMVSAGGSYPFRCALCVRYIASVFSTGLPVLTLDGAMCTMSANSVRLGAGAAVALSSTRLLGELYRVSKAQLEGPCDRLESHPTFYRRELVDVRLMSQGQQGDVLRAWLYLLVSADHLEGIRSDRVAHPEVRPLGDWRSFCEGPPVAAAEEGNPPEPEAA